MARPFNIHLKTIFYRFGTLNLSQKHTIVPLVSFMLIP